MSSCSATGNPRNKVALKPGHSLMDWIRLGKSGKDLTGTDGAYLTVTKSQLAQHNKLNDAWICIRGKVYNVTSYMDFHPGGSEELMKGVGTDATKIFNEVHAWVNYESILQKCIVGQLRTSADDEDDITSSPTGLSPPETPSKPKLNNEQCNSKVPNSGLQMDWFQQVGSICLVFYPKTPGPSVHIQLEDNEVLTIKINSRLQRIRLAGTVDWPSNVTVDAAGKVQVRLTKCSPGLWSRFGCQEPGITTVSDYWEVSVMSSIPITNNTYQIDLAYTDHVFNYVAVGHHVLVKARIEDEEVVRPYTPVTSLAGLNIPPTGCVRLIVKAYPTGVLSPWLVAQAPGAKLHLSLPRGSFSPLSLGLASHLVLLAAGTGLTPMVALITWALRSSKMDVQLVFFNKSEADIIWGEQLEKLMSDNPRFNVNHVLSQASPAWTGKTGHVSSSLLQSYLPTASPDIPNIYYACVCGPTSFTQLTERYLTEDLCFTISNYHCFLGN